MNEKELNQYTDRVMTNKYSLMDIDINIMIPSFKFKTVDDYYDHS